MDGADNEGEHDEQLGDNFQSVEEEKNNIAFIS